MNDYFFAEVLLRNNELTFLSIVTKFGQRNTQEIAQEFAEICEEKSPINGIEIRTNDVVVHSFATKAQAENFRKEKIETFNREYPSGTLIQISEQDFS